MATPFVQGRLRNEKLSVRIDSQCAECHTPLEIDVSERMEWAVRSGTDRILVFEPSIDWSTFKQPTIVRDY
jgi:hypothetical protein